MAGHGQGEFGAGQQPSSGAPSRIQKDSQGLISPEIEAAATAHGRAIKGKNALTAILFSATLSVVVAEVFSFKPAGFFAGILIGLLYSNGFEYFLHRFLLHLGASFFAQQHNIHHSTWGAPDEARYVNFARNSWVVVVVFALNTAPFIVAEWLFRPGIAPGVIVGFALYFVVYEEVHWRIHLGGWLPSWLSFARRHHLMHHAGAEERYNVFLPVFDWVFALGRK